MSNILVQHVKTCPDNVDYRGVLWNTTRVNTTSVYDCKTPFTGNLFFLFNLSMISCAVTCTFIIPFVCIAGFMSRNCGLDGTWRLPVYACVRQDITDASKTVYLNQVLRYTEQ